ncbi:MAG: PQQ-binding-like beta-propeller repeat protein [Phycisphaerales bacterium JB059]
MPRAHLLLVALSASLVLGCESTPTATSSGSGDTNAPLSAAPPADADQASPTGGVVTDAEGFRIVHDDWSRLGYRWDWTSRPFISPRGTITDFVPAGDLVIAQESGSNLSVLDAATGRLLWTSQLGSRFTKFVGSVRDGDIILTSSASELFELGASSGNLVGKSKFRFLVDSPPVLVGDLAIYASGSGKLLAHSRSAGVGSWAYGLSGQIVVPPVRVGDSIIGAVSQGGDVIFLDPTTGASVGRNKISAGVEGVPVADAERMYVASLDQSIYAFDAIEGALAWRVRTKFPVRAQPALHDGSLYIALATHGMTAFDTVDGSLRWRNDAIHGEVIGVRDGELLVWDGADLALLDPQNGDVIRRHTFPGAQRVVTDRFVDGALYVVGQSGAIVRFVPRS